MPGTGQSRFTEPGESGYGPLPVGEPAGRWGVRTGPVPCTTVGAEVDFGR